MGKIRKPRPTRAKKNVNEEETLEDEEQVTVGSKETVVQTILDQLEVCYSRIIK